MIGTLLNVATILIGGALGLLFGARFPERVRQTVIAGLGLFTAIIGIQMTFDSKQPLILLGSLLIGGLLGEWWQIEERLRSVGVWLEKRYANGSVPDPADTGLAANSAVSAPEAHVPANQSSRFVRGFLTASLVYAVGPMAILGAIQDGLTGNFSLLAIKATLDGFASIAFASSLGIGVLFSSLIILVYQGGLSLLAAQADAWITPLMMNEMTAAGGVLLVGIAISSLLEIKPIRVANLLPALIVAPLIVAVLVALGVAIE